MPAGLQVWSSNGVLEVDLTTKLLRVRDIITFNGAGGTGSRTYTITRGETLIIVTNFNLNAFLVPPRFIVEGGNVTWEHTVQNTQNTYYNFVTGSAFVLAV